jgi:uncharacterized protein (DUF849 family)
MNTFILNFASTGIIPTKEINPYTPIQPDEIIRDVLFAHDVGAAIAHIHARDRSGKPTRDPEIYKRIVGEIRSKAPDIIICISLSSRINDGFGRLAPLNIGDEKPDMASLTVGSTNLPTGPTINPVESIIETCERLNELDIKPEVEAFEPGMIEFCNYLIKKRKMRAPVYCNMFFGARGASGLNAANIAAFERNAPHGSILCAAGIGRFQSQTMAIGLALFDGIRVGIEDCPYKNYTTKEPVSNKELLENALGLAENLDRKPIKPHVLRTLLNEKRYFPGS